jgi:cytochrome b
VTGAAEPGPEGAWDLPTRLFHWALVVLVVFSYATGKIGGGWMEWHMRSGYAVLALLGFRLAWGFVGPAHARFASFLRGPSAAAAYVRALRGGERRRMPGHNPLGGWMVMLMLGLLLLQAGTGLFSNDESAHEGPLAVKVSNAVVDRMSTLHGINQGVIVTAVVIHVLAVTFYQWRLRMDVLRPMIAGAPSRAATLALAALLLAVSAAAVYALVAIYSRP